MKSFIVTCAFFILAAASGAFAENIVLPNPEKSGGSAVLDAIENRASAAQENYNKEEVSQKDIATLLWAARGKNRDQSGWTIPTMLGREPYVDVYVLLKTGSYKYNYEKNALMEISNEKRLIQRAVNSEYSKSAPCIIVFVSSGRMNSEKLDCLAAGAMSQNVYLAAEALGLKVRFSTSYNQVAIEEYLALGPVMKIIGLMTVGYQ